MMMNMTRKMTMAHDFPKRIFIWLFLLFLLFACTSKQVVDVPEVVPPSLSVLSFPPQKAMESGDYGGFLATNEKALKECGEAGQCEIALFNLGFVHAYSKSSHYNPSKALRYFQELVKKYPQSPWAFQARAWIDLIKKSIASENVLRRLKDELKSKDSAIDELQDLKEVLKSRESAINELQERMRRSRDIDVEIDQRERYLLK